MGNEKRLLSAGFMAILAAGVGFAVRGGIFGNWAGEFGFTGAELGAIGGAGFTGFCFGIVIGGMLIDTLIASFLIPVSFYVVEKIARAEQKRALAPHPALSVAREGEADACPVIPGRT